MINDKLTKDAHFLAIKVTFTSGQWEKLYKKEIVRLHGVPLRIVLYQDTKFLPRFWHGFQKAIGTELCLNTTFHP